MNNGRTNTEGHGCESSQRTTRSFVQGTIPGTSTIPPLVTYFGMQCIIHFSPTIPPPKFRYSSPGSAAEPTTHHPSISGMKFRQIEISHHLLNFWVVRTSSSEQSIHHLFENRPQSHSFIHSSTVFLSLSPILRQAMTTVRGGCQPKDTDREAEPSDNELQRVVEYSDNDVQKQILLEHYHNEATNAFPNKDALDAFLRDYTDNSVVNLCIDEVANTLHGVEGGRHLWEKVCSSSHNLDLQQVLIQNNHAKVVWQAQLGPPGIPEEANSSVGTVLVGTDWFTFDLQNHIQTQTTVAVSQKNND